VATLIGPVTGVDCLIAMSFDGNGDLYGYDVCVDAMFFIDKANANAVNLGLLPFDANFGQGMGYDPATDTVYLAAFNNGTFVPELWTYDTGTNTYTFMGVLGSVVPGGLAQLPWLGFEGGPPQVCDAPSDIPWASVDPITGTVAAGSSVVLDVTFDSTGLPAGTYSGVLCVHSNDPDPGPGNGTDLVTVDLEMVVEAEPDPDPLVCNAAPIAFEGGIPSDWAVLVNTGPVYWSTTDDLAACDNGGNQTLGSGEAACADSDETNIGGSPYDTELWSNSFDLTGYTNVTLQFAGAYNDISPGGGDLFEIWVWDGSTWIMEAQWDADFNQIVMQDLSAYGGLPDVGVSFRYHGDAWDWFVQVDDVSLICVGEPDIFVDPLFIGSTQNSNTTTNHSLDIGNVGTGELNWSIEEDNSAPLPPFVAGTHAASAGMAPGTSPKDVPVTSVVLGSNAYSSDSVNGYYTVFDIDVPDTLPNIAPFVPAGFPGAGEYYNGLVYIADGVNTMYVLDPLTGAQLNSYPVTAPPNSELVPQS
jgi:hypothetical protein